MNGARVLFDNASFIDLKERIALADGFTPEERTFILDAVNAAADVNDLDLGPCCNCERTDGVTNIVMLHRRGPTPGKGWGCVICNLPSDGAVAVLCDVCATIGEYPKYVCTGYAREPGRTLFSDLDPIVFDHILSAADHER